MSEPAAPEAWTREGRGPRRRTRWDRPPAPHDWRFYVGWSGRALIVLSLLMFLFVGYQLWGTGIETARAQHRLDDEFAELLEQNTGGAATTAPMTVPSTTDAVATTPPATEPDATPTPAPTPAPVPVALQNLPAPARGDPVAQITIDRIGIEYTVVAGVGRNELKAGPGWFSDSSLPGQLGNSAIAGHRTTYGAPFGDLDDLRAGDEVVTSMLNGYRYVYVVTGSEVVEPSEYRVVTDSDPTRATLTLVTCTPPNVSTERLVVYAELDPARSGPVGETAAYDLDAPSPTTDLPTPDATAVTTPATTGAPPGTTTPSTVVPVEGGRSTPAADGDAFASTWFADSAAWPQIALWGALLAAIVTAGWWLARTWKREWVGALAALLPSTITLYFLFQNVNRLLPAGL